MKKHFWILPLILLCNTAQSQFRLSMQAGPVLSLKDKKQDSAFFSSKGMQEQIKVGYYKGRLGVVLGGSFVQQKAGNVAEENRLPKFPLGQAGLDSSLAFSGGNISTTLFTVVPQLCFPMGKIKLHVMLGAGLAMVKADSAVVAIKSNTTNTSKNVYYNTADNPSAPVVVSGFTLQFPIAKKIGLDITTEYISYTIAYANNDRRNNFATKNGKDKKQLLSIKAGLTFKL